MNLFSSLAAIASLAAIPGTEAKPVRLPDGVTIVEDHVGFGKFVEDGDKVTVQYRVWNSQNVEFADSTKRGLPFTMVVGRRNSDPLVSVALAGMRAGGTRTVALSADWIPEGIGSIVPPKTDLQLWIYVVAAKPAPVRGIAAKVESPHAERTQGALEVPRVAPGHGSTRT